MHTDIYRLTFAPHVALERVENCLDLALWGAGSLYGSASLRLQVSYLLDRPRRALVLQGQADVGQATIGLFIGFLTRECGMEGFTLQRLPECPSNHRYPIWRSQN